MPPRPDGLLLGLLMLLPVPVFAGLVQVSGVVTDPLGAPIEGARVEARLAGVAPGRDPSALPPVLTGLDGRYHLAIPADAQVQLTVSRAGFATWRGGLPSAPAAIRLLLAPVVTSVELGAAPDTASTAQSVTTIERVTLRDPGLSVLSQSALTAPGLHTLTTSPAMGVFMVRGLTGKNVAVLRDGVRYTTSAQRGGVSTFFNLLDAGNGIETVEVLRGPNGAEHGSDSIGGAVVALSPAPPDFDQPLHGSAAASYESAANSFGPSLAASFGGRHVAAVTRLAARRVNTLRPAQGVDSHAAITRFLGLPSDLLGEGGRLPDTGFTGYGGSFHGQARLGLSSHLVLHYDRGQQDGTRRYDQLLGGDGNLIADVRNLMADFGYLRWERWNSGAPGDAWLDRLSISASYNAQREERVNQGGQGNPLGAVTHQYEKTRASGLQVQAARRLPAGVEFTAGGEAYRERIAAPSFQFAPATGRTTIVRPRIPDQARYLIHGVYAQGVWQPLHTDRLRVSAATRFGGASYRSTGNLPLWPADSLAANALTGRAGGVFWATSWFGAHVNWARGFRAPSVTDLGTVGLQGNGAFEAAVADLAGRGATIGDRADDRAVSTGRALERLRPEDSRNLDYGVRFRHDRFTADITAFHLSLGNAIVSQTLILPPGAVGSALGDQTITRQLASGAVFVPASSSPVLVRGNYAGFRQRGLEQSLQWRPASSWRIRQNVTWLRAEDAVTGLAPDVEPGLPPVTANLSAAYTRRRFWIEGRAHAAGRQSRLSSLALSDRRIGNPRSRATIASFFNNGARARGLVSPAGILIPTGETLASVQDRVIGGNTTAAVPQFTALPGYFLLGLAAGVELTESCTLDLGLSNLADRRYRGIGWGVDGPGRAAAVALRYRF